MTIEIEFKDAMSQFATGVTIVTTKSADGLYGMTVGSFTSVSLSPPLVSIAIDKRFRCHDLITQQKFFGVSVLASAQIELGKRFSDPTINMTDRFNTMEYKIEATGSPIIINSISWFDCSLQNRHDVGDHSIFIGRVLACGANPNQAPLIYHNRSWTTVE